MLFLPLALEVINARTPPQSVMCNVISDFSALAHSNVYHPNLFAIRLGNSLSETVRPQHFTYKAPQSSRPRFCRNNSLKPGEGGPLLSLKLFVDASLYNLRLLSGVLLWAFVVLAVPSYYSPHETVIREVQTCQSITWDITSDTTSNLRW